MNDDMILDELLELLQRKGVSVRTEAMGGSAGGLCKIKELDIFFVDQDASAADMCPICAEAVTQMLDIESVYMRPEVREFIEKNCHAD